MPEKTLGTYIGACGFQSSQQVLEIWQLLRTFDQDSPTFMVGAMTSHKILHGLSTRHTIEYPPVDNLKDIFSVKDPRIVNCLHYANYDAKRGFDLCSELSILMDCCGPHLGAIQLDMPWPEVAELQKFKNRFESVDLILQVGPDAMYTKHEDPMQIAHEVKHYVGLISHVLLDASGGEGIPIDTSLIEGYIDSIGTVGCDVQFAVAGGLGPKTVGKVAGLVREYGVSIDAQTALTKTGKSGDLMDITLTKLYVEYAYRLYAGTLPKANVA